MSKKTLKPNPCAWTGGYVRVSKVAFPSECQTPEQRAAFVEDMRQVRRAELVADAAKHGDKITVWYDDMGISGRGEFLARRADFERARADARSGRLRCLYGRDLSRLFRDLVQQELWFTEMEQLGVTVRLQDLPETADPATGRLIRQQFGAVHEYHSARMGEVILSVRREKVRSGQSAGTGRSRWGLRYDRATQSYFADPDTADKIRLVFEAFVAADGVAGKAARALNRAADGGAVGGTRSPYGAEWSGTLVFNQVRCPLYRRTIAFGDVRRHSPERVPEVLSPALVAEADRLLEKRQRIYEALSPSLRRPREPFTYTGILRCAACGSLMTVVSKDDFSGRRENRWAAWCCRAAGTRGPTACEARFTARQARVEALAGRLFARAFRDYGGRYTPPAGGATSEGHMNTGVAARLPALEGTLGRLARKRERYIELYAAGLIPDLATLRPHLERIDEEVVQLRVRAVTVQVETEAEGIVIRRETFDRLQKGYERAWTTPCMPLKDPLRDQQRREFLLSANASLRVRFHPRPAEGPRASVRGRVSGGPITVTLEFPPLGLVGDRALSLTDAGCDDLQATEDGGAQGG